MRVRIVLASMVAAALVLPCLAQDQTAPPSTLQNPGFETPSVVGGATIGSHPDSWFYFASNPESKSGITDARKKGGLQCMVFKMQPQTNAYIGIAQKVTAEENKHYSFSAYVMMDPADLLAGGAYGQVSLEWQNSDGVEISRTFGPIWSAERTPGRWEKFLVEGDAPAKVAFVVTVITSYAQNSAGAGTFYVDDCEFTSRAPEK